MSTGPGTPPGDAGLQNERTGLAWQRTVLSGLAYGLLLSRLLAAISLTLAIATCLSALGLTAAFGWVALDRFRLDARALTTGSPIADGRQPALAGVLLVLIGLGALGYVLLV